MHRLTRRDRRPLAAEQPPGAPRWAKVTGIVALILVLLVVVLLVAGGGKHGPGRHFGAASPTRVAQVHPPPRHGDR